MFEAKLMKGLLIASCVIFGNSTPAFASGKIGYGSRIGMTVTVFSMQGLDTANSIIRTKHTRDDAIVFCREYANDTSEKCIEDELSIPLNDVIVANCLNGVFTDFHGDRYRFEGKRKRGSAFDSKYVIRKLSTGEIADGSTGSGYPTTMGIFKALCPRSLSDLRFSIRATC